MPRTPKAVEVNSFPVPAIEIANVANVLHPFVQTADAVTAYVTNVGGAALTANVSLKLKGGGPTGIAAVQGLVRISAGPDVDTATPGTGTRLSPAPAGNAPYALDVLANSSGVIVVPIVFHAAGAALSKQIVIQYGEYRITIPGFTVS